MTEDRPLSFIFDRFYDLNTFLEKKCISFTDSEIKDQDYNWIEFNVDKVNSEYYKCPLFDIVIYEGDCYDINMVRSKCVKREVLQSFEMEIGEKVDLDKANLICDSCKHKL